MFTSIGIRGSKRNPHETRYVGAGGAIAAAG
jgi:hypothetical protein